MGFDKTNCAKDRTDGSKPVHYCNPYLLSDIYMFGFHRSSKKDPIQSSPTVELPVTTNETASPATLTGEATVPPTAMPVSSPVSPPAISPDSFPQHRSNTTMRLNKNNGDKREDDLVPSDIVPAFSATRTLQSFNTSGEESSSLRAVVGAKIVFRGELSGEEDLLIQGRVEGTVDLKGFHLTVGKLGVVKANLKAKSITIEGTVEGDLFAQERISIKASSDVTGNLVADRVTLEDGAKFRGTIDMESNKKIGNGAPVDMESNKKTDNGTSTVKAKPEKSQG